MILTRMVSPAVVVALKTCVLDGVTLAVAEGVTVTGSGLLLDFGRMLVLGVSDMSGTGEVLGDSLQLISPLGVISMLEAPQILTQCPSVNRTKQLGLGVSEALPLELLDGVIETKNVGGSEGEEVLVMVAFAVPLPVSTWMLCDFGNSFLIIK